MRLFLVDAYAIIYRSYYALINSPRFSSKTGLNTSTIYGFLNTLHEIISKENPSHIAVAFDTGKPTFRHEMFPQYKAQREKTPEDITAAVPYVKKIIQAYNIPILQADGYEADDIIASAAKKAELFGFDVYMLTPDKDYCQLVTPHCFLYRPRHGGGYEIMGPDEVQAKYGLSNPGQMVDLLGLMGDKSDNIPGCPGVGEKTAVALLREFGSIDNLLRNTDKLKGALKGKIEIYQEQIKTSRFLARIKNDVDIPFDEQALRLNTPDLDKLNELLDELDFKSKAKKINAFYKRDAAPAPAPKQEQSLFDIEFGYRDDSDDTAKSDSATELQKLTEHPHEFKVVGINAMDELCQLMQNAQELCIKTITASQNPRESDLLGISFSWKQGDACFVPINTGNKATAIEKLKPVLENPSILKIGHNIKSDIVALHANGIELGGPLFDTMIAHYLLQPERQHGLENLAEIYLDYAPTRFEDIAGNKGKKQKSLTELLPETVHSYACETAETTFRLKNPLEKEIEEQGLHDLFYTVEMPLARCLADMETVGVRIDSAELKASSIKLTEEANRIEQSIQEIAGEPLNLNSPKQVGELLFDRLKLNDKAKKTGKGQYSTSEEILEMLRGKHPVVELILDFRKIKKLLSTYIDTLPDLADPATGKIHTSFNQTVTATGRLSSTNPNLQNIPIREEMGKEIRKAFIPDDGCIFLSADYSQIELRLMAHLSKDRHMCEAFNSGEDIHTATAAKIYGIPISSVTADMRRMAKTANFGIIYGITAFGLAQRLSIGRPEAKKLIDDYFASYPQVKEYIDNCIEKARENGYAETILGRKRYLPDIRSANSVVRGFAERNAVNAPIQGSAADIIKIAMVRICEKMKSLGLRSQMILQVHDELNFNVFPEELETVREIVMDGMENAVKLDVPLIADCGTGRNWLESH